MMATTDHIRVLSDIEAQEYQRTPGLWVVANVEQQFGWPKEPKLVRYKQNKLLFLPQGNETYPAIAVKSDEISGEPKEVLAEFLSALSWHENHSILIKHWSGGSSPIQMGRDNFLFPVAFKYRLDFLEVPNDKNGRLALAFYRDALSLNHVAYSFLSFYKIINLRFPVAEIQKKWINANIGVIDAPRALDRLNQLGAIDIGNYLYVSGRCAVAHAGMDPVVDPDSAADYERLSADLPLIRSLAERAIETEFGIRSSRTIRTEHKYQTEKIRELLGEELVGRIVDGQPLEASVTLPDFVSVRLNDQKQNLSLERMQITAVVVHQERVFLQCKSANSLTSFRIGFDFRTDHMVFDPQRDYAIEDDGSAEAASNAVDWASFMEKYYLNGVLELWDPVADVCLARADTFVPVNIDPRGTAENLSKLKAEYQSLQEERLSRHDAT